MKNKRLGRVVLPCEELEEYFRGNCAIIEGLPDDATVVRVYEDHSRMTFELIFESDEFPYVEQGQEVPEVNIVAANRRISSTEYHACPNCHTVTKEGDIISGT